MRGLFFVYPLALVGLLAFVYTICVLLCALFISTFNIIFLAYPKKMEGGKRGEPPFLTSNSAIEQSLSFALCDDLCAL